MDSSNLSLKKPAAKANTIMYAPENWFSVKDYLRLKVNDMKPSYDFNTKMLELLEGELPGEKTLAMRLYRYYKQGLLKRKRDGHRFLYMKTRKGELRGVFLKKRYESVYKKPYSPHRGHKDFRLYTDANTKPNTSEGIKMYTDASTKPNTSEGIGSLFSIDKSVVRRCSKCGQFLGEDDVVICPHCHKLT